MKILGDSYTISDFRKYVMEKDFGSIPPTSLVIHHTWRPTKAQWQGKKSIYGMKSYYENTKKWNAGPHLFIAEDGVWTFTDMYDVGIHAGVGNSTYKWGKLTGYSIGIEVVGDYDNEIWTGKTKKNALATIKILMDKLNLNYEDIRFHRDFSTKSCPGHAIKKQWLIGELKAMSSDGKQTATVSNTEPSAWAKEAWAWFRRNSFDDSVSPHQEVHAEWVATMIHSFYNKYKGKKIKK